MVVANLVNELKAFLSNEQIEEGQNKSHPFGNNGRVIVYPYSEDEIVNVLKFANGNGKKITVAGGGTKRGFGGLKEVYDILLSLEKYSGIVEHTVGDMTLTVKAGTRFEELQHYLAKHNQQISLDPAWGKCSTIGGVIAANDSGPKRLGYGSVRDAVIGLRMIYPDGSIIRTGGKVVKNVAGYDMNKLFIGSMGTLGIISEITLKLRPLAKYESLILLSFPDGNFDEIRLFTISLLDSMIEPVSLELLNPSLAKHLTNQNTYTLAISFADVESSVHYQEDFVKNKLKPANVTMNILQQEQAQAFWDQLYTLTPNGSVISNKQQTEAALKIGIKNLDVIDVIKKAQLLQDTNNLSIFAHGGLGHGICQVILRGASDDVLSAIKHLREAVTPLKGYVVVKSIPFALREKVNVWGEKPSYFMLLEGIKAKIDPNKVLNDKRFVGGL